MSHDSPYTNSVVIIQSSDTRKSWMVHEQANLIFTIPFNLCQPVDNNGEVDFMSILRLSLIPVYIWIQVLPSHLQMRGLVISSLTHLVGMLLRTGPHGILIWNWDIASVSKGYGKLSMVLARQKDLASTCVLHLQIVPVL